VAVKALEARRLEPARQLLQQAAKLGATEASLRLAEMYDPKTWSSDQSPVEQPDWETASYWYEEAARGGEARGMIGAGRLYCEFAVDPVFIERGLEWLRKAATAPDAGAEVKKLLTACEGKSP
jgi:TPR repeat protein